MRGSDTDPYDLFVIGGGINGCGIARDAAGRGASVALAEMNDLASATSSASTKLFHGGLRYLEYFELRLVREALEERETLLRAMPHISWPMRFVLPIRKDMRFDSETPASKLLSTVMPWMRGRRPFWMIRLGLFLYDRLGGREILPATSSLDLTTAPEGAVLIEGFDRAYEYSDCWVDDARLVVLNARDAAAKGAKIMVRTRVTTASREGHLWRIETVNSAGAKKTYYARSLINAAGPWVGHVIHDVVDLPSTENVRLVRGSHIVTPRLFDHEKCYFFQGTDGRIIFAIPYEQDFTLIGTTDRDHDGADTKPVCTDAERDYLLDFANRYFAKSLTADDVVWTYSGVRPLYDDGSKSATATTREYVLKLDTDGAPVINVFGGKITTYRRLAESALEMMAPHVPVLSGSWTAGAPLPGGDFPVADTAALLARLRLDYPFLSDFWSLRLIRSYGTEAWDILGEAKSLADLGTDFGASLTQTEVDWLLDNEFARTSEDIIWRRSKLGLRLDAAQVASLSDYVAGAVARR